MKLYKCEKQSKLNNSLTNEIKKNSSNIFSYVESYSNHPINDKYPLNNLDYLILCRISYMYFEGLLNEKYTYKPTLKEIGPKYLDLVKIDSCTVLQVEDVDLLSRIMNTKRYGNLRLTGYVSIYSEKNTEQFAALTIILPNKKAFISYRGTDGSLNGWREDFNLGFLGVLPSDIDALNYLDDTIKELEGTIDSFIVGGHSKGGNLAAYACCKTSKKNKKKIEKIVLLDAPGFRRDVILTMDINSIQNKVLAFGPCQSMIGVILYNIAPMKAVVSDKILVFQHDIYQWRISGLDFYYGSFQPVTWATKKMTKDVFETMNHEHLQQCLDMLFGIIKDSNNSSSTPAAGITNWSRMFSIIFLLRKLNKDERNTYLKLFSMVSKQIKVIEKADKNRSRYARKYFNNRNKK